jgi:hypothetical protein
MIEASALAFNCSYSKMQRVFQQITEPIAKESQCKYIHLIATKSSPVLEAFKHYNK